MSRWLRRKIVVLAALVLAAPVVSQTTVGPPRLPVVELPGTVFIAGGGALPEAVRQRFVQLAGGKDAKLVVVSAATDVEQQLAAWKQLGPASVVPLVASQRDDADKEAFVKPLAEATAVWLVGDPDKLASAWRGTAAEKELHKLLQRGGTIGAPAATVAVLGPVMWTGKPQPEFAPAFGLLPGALVEPRLRPGERDAVLLAKQPGYFGLSVEDRTALIVKGRRLTVVGDGAAAICQAAGANRPASQRSLKTGEVADLVAQSRIAISRAQPPFPPEKPAAVSVPKGALVIGGGGGMSLDVWKRFIDLAGGPDAPLVVIPTALEDPVPAEPGEVKALKKAGAKNIRIMHTRDRAEADKAAFAAPLREAKGVWFSGGRQWRFVDAYEGTLTEKGFHDVLARGGVIGGSSAGASIQTEYMPRGDPLGNLNIIAEGYERGFGFLKGAAVDQHFFARNRTKDMTELIKTYPQLLGIGIDENTTIIVQGTVLEVMGKTKVAVYDRRQPIKDGALDYEELPSGTRYDLEKRKRID
ncbi:MAG: Type 1 glutamine amidotransferase-like domain-containing protein [Planctomycetia bacterium]|nr:Type 1 glutamine amidotransferase-like domain-containing protein [Planctomycetia bacterium]